MWHYFLPAVSIHHAASYLTAARVCIGILLHLFSYQLVEQYFQLLRKPQLQAIYTHILCEAFAAGIYS